ncbi:MAG: hypothetical protein Q7S66_05360 [bacterium]|nr:hypothetical protein [bacterium]
MKKLFAVLDFMFSIGIVLLFMPMFLFAAIFTLIDRLFQREDDWFQDGSH